jgi:diguanylate cyclase (GGDEF)-like protein
MRTATQAVPRDRAAGSRRASLQRAVGAYIRDVLVFEHSDAGFSLVGGTGRGEGWAGIVDFADDRSLVAQAWAAGGTLRHSDPRDTHVAGPYHSVYAVAVPAGDRYVVVFGSEHRIALSDAELLRLAADAVDRIDGVPADKILADELELVHALRRMTAYRPENVADTMRHIAQVAAAALSCEVAYVRVEREGIALTTGLDAVENGAIGVSPALDGYLASMAAHGIAIVEQTGGEPDSLFGIQIASHMALPIGNDPAYGAIALAHAAARPRGFTSLCQRIGRAVAEAAELLIAQAVAREQLAAERDLLIRMTGTDALTGIANRRAWDDEVRRLAEGELSSGYLISCDLDGLKEANDRYGHPVGDALIRATASLLTSTVRDGDLVARIGGDEFVVLLRGADERAARRVYRRIRRAELGWRVTEHGLTPSLSIGLACMVGNDAEAARAEADARMFVNKRKRAAQQGRHGTRRALPDRRAAKP